MEVLSLPTAKYVVLKFHFPSDCSQPSDPREESLSVLFTT